MHRIIYKEQDTDLPFKHLFKLKLRHTNRYITVNIDKKTEDDDDGLKRRL